MIVVLGSRHDEVARDLVAGWPNARLCSAEDLIQSGWVWPVLGSTRSATWIVDGIAVPDECVVGVFLRRSTVHPEELRRTHPNDRAYLAAELHAFLVHVLSRTGAWVVSPVDEGGAYGDAALRPERWMTAAAAQGLAVAPLRICAEQPPDVPAVAARCEVVAGEPIGKLAPRLADAAVNVCGRLGLRFAVVSFDASDRLVGLTCSVAPSPAARAALERQFTSRGAA